MLRPLRLGDLPEDLFFQCSTMMGPPPSHFNSLQYLPLVAKFDGHTFGDHQKLISMLTDIKADQEMSKRIPKAADRYTDINPISPLFRRDTPMYGFGSWGGSTIILILVTLAAAGVGFCFLKKKK